MKNANYGASYNYKKKSTFKIKLENFFRAIRQKGRENLTVMFIPHSETKIMNFQISYAALIFAIFIIGSITVGGLYLITERNSMETKNEKISKDLLTVHSYAEGMRIEIDPLRKTANKLKEVTDNFQMVIGNREKLKTTTPGKDEGMGGPEIHEKVLPNKEDSNPQEIELKRLNTKFGFIANRLKGLNTTIEGFKGMLNDMPSIFPVLGSSMGRGYITSHFGWRRDPFTNRLTEHHGVDIVNLIGTPIVATAEGIVKNAQRGGGRGLFVEIEHKFGYTTQYLHMSAIKVRVGDQVRKGQVIGNLGNTGRSTGPHLHYEVRINKIPIDPSPFTRLDKFW